MASSSCGVQSPGCRKIRERRNEVAPQWVQFDQKEEDLFAFATTDREHPVGRNRLHRLAVVVIHLELILLVDRIRCLAADHCSFFKHQLPEAFAHVSVLTDHLRDDVPRAFQGLFGTGDALFRTDEVSGEQFERFVRRLLCPEIKGKRLQPLFACDDRFRAALGPIGQVEVFQFALVEGGLDSGFQLLGELSLLGDRGNDRLAPRDQIAEVGESFLDVADLDFVEISRRLLAIASNEWNGSALVEQFYDGNEAAHWDVESLGNLEQQLGRKGLSVSHR